MDPNALGGMLFTLLMTIVIIGGILAFPIMRRLGSALELWLNDKRHAQAALPPADTKALRDTIRALADRLESIEDRQTFLEELVEGRGEALPGGQAGGALPPETRPRDGE